MGLPTVSRRSFIGSLLSIFAFISCKKTPSIETINIPFTDPLATDPNFDLGAFTKTEFGNQLYLPVDISKIFHGYADKLSYKPGETVSLYLSGPPNASQIIGLDDINGNNVVSVTTTVDFQVIDSDDISKPWIDGFMYNETTQVKLPDTLKSGVYRFPGDIPIVCKGNDSLADITVVLASNTFNAYCDYGGKSLYRPGDPNTEAADYRATVLSFSRYNPLLSDSSENFSESFVRWMGTQTYNTRYIADIDLEDYSEIESSKLLIVAGKSEYWSRQARMNFDKFVASGKNALVLSGNTMYWQVRYNLKRNLMICYKSNTVDPLGNTLYSTCLWDTPGLNYPVLDSIGANFNGGGYPMKVANPLNGFKIAKASSPLLKGTGLKNGDLLHLPTIETDGAPLKKMLLPDSAEIPEIDNSKLNFHKIDLVAYTFSLNPNNDPGIGTFVVFQKTPSSGTVVNVASTNWCSSTGIGGADGPKIEIMTKNMIDGSLNSSNLFSE